ncbi:diadenylate cyclase [Desulfosarcina sp. OttesenSCG-928-A07]|nr:diadenylate cyclase [Desulfosarcina sp. OttesenSCG-928-G17]MDL2329517.1 diadenylate cyclase [Desulfosarcina sp. OttesenSCG-928-A07]
MTDFFSFASGFRWQDAVDILLNSYILFRLYVLFRGTRVVRVIMVIPVVWLLERMAVYLGLIITAWGMQGIIAAAALVIVIVFRNEITSVFQTRGLKSFFWGIPQRQVHTPVDMIVESVYELAHRRLGAIIVLPLKKAIDTIVQGGVAWRGKLSREMLLSIFWKGTPVHDGATIVQGDQVTDVAVILPLSKREDLPSYFGTRHRAAVGLAEQSDALVIVVSEERGSVTVFQDKNIRPIHDNIELGRILREHAGAVTQNGGLKRQTMELALAAMICFTSIAGIWISFAHGLETLISLDVPVEFMNRGTGMEIFSASVSKVDLQLSGSGGLIRSIRPDQVKIKLDLSHAVPGKNIIPISPESITLPPGIKFKQAMPKVLEVHVDKLDQKDVGIQVDWSGKLMEDLIVESVRVVPDRLWVHGASLILKDIETIYTEKILLDTITDTGKVSVHLVLQPALALEKDQKSRVEVMYEVRRR